MCDIRMVRLFFLLGQAGYGVSIFPKNHLIKKEIILYWCHLSADIVKGTKPNIHLLCNGGVEVVLSILIHELWVALHVALLLAKCIGGLVLGFVVECINTHTHPIEKLDPSLLDFTKSIAIRVIDHMLGFSSPREGEDLLK